MAMGGRFEGPPGGASEPERDGEGKLDKYEPLLQPLLTRSLDRYREAKAHAERQEACPSPEELAAFRAGTAPHDLRERILDHAFLNDGCCLTGERPTQATNGTQEHPKGRSRGGR